MSDETETEGIDLTDFSEQEAKAPAPDDTGEDGNEQETPSEELAAADSGGEDVEQRTAADLEAVFDVPVNIAAILGGTNIEVSDLLKLNEGDIVELDRKVGEAIDIFVNNRLVARGEVVLVEDRLGVTMTEIIKGDKLN